MEKESSAPSTPGPSAALDPSRRTKSAPDVGTDDGMFGDGPQVPSRTYKTTKARLPRASDTEEKRRSHASAEFDRRYDGPFGRPSMSMARRPIPEATVSAGDIHQLQHVPSEQALDFSPTPPPLNYSLRDRKKGIFIFWSLMIFDCVLMPVSLYFGLWYGVGPGAASRDDQKLSANVTVSIVTAAIGGASILEYIIRFWRLWKKGSTCRVIGAHRWYLDWFHWSISLAWFIVMIELIVGTIPEDPPIRLLSMPLPSVLFVFGSVLLLVDVLRFFRVPAPVRISSVPKGAQLRPGIYSFIEDACAVDGNGGTEFRERLDTRYEASHVFRAMLRRLGIFWAFGAEACAALCTGCIFGLDTNAAAFAIGWSVPAVWAGLWSIATFWYVSHELKVERALWIAEASKARV